MDLLNRLWTFAAALDKTGSLLNFLHDKGGQDLALPVANDFHMVEVFIPSEVYYKQFHFPNVEN